jgi:hypothetical protein
LTSAEADRLLCKGPRAFLCCGAPTSCLNLKVSVWSLCVQERPTYHGASTAGLKIQTQNDMLSMS